MPGFCSQQDMGPAPAQPAGTGGMCGPYKDLAEISPSQQPSKGYSLPGQYQGVPVNRVAPKMNGIWGSPR